MNPYISLLASYILRVCAPCDALLLGVLSHEHLLVVTGFHFILTITVGGAQDQPLLLHFTNK